MPIIIIDEFDKLRDREARELTANVIRALYDYTVNVTVIIVGVAEDIGELVQDHQSIRRALSQVKLERMTPEELNEIIDKRMRRAPLKIAGDARWTIVTLSRGLPYYVHMLSKYAAQRAAADRKLLIGTSEAENAMDKFIEESDQSFQEDYRLATDSNQADNLFKEVLHACALCQADESGFFTPTAVIEPLNAIAKKRKRHAHFQRHLTEFMGPGRGSVIIRRGAARQYRYRFADPMMQPYVIIRGIRSGMVDEATKKSLLYLEQPMLPNVYRRPYEQFQSVGPDRVWPPEPHRPCAQLRRCRVLRARLEVLGLQWRCRR
jgi:hypothetical protein